MSGGGSSSGTKYVSFANVKPTIVTASDAKKFSSQTNVEIDEVKIRNNANNDEKELVAAAMNISLNGGSNKNLPSVVKKNSMNLNTLMRIYMPDVIFSIINEAKVNIGKKNSPKSVGTYEDIKSMNEKQWAVVGEWVWKNSRHVQKYFETLPTDETDLSMIPLMIIGSIFLAKKIPDKDPLQMAVLAANYARILADAKSAKETGNLDIAAGAAANANKYTSIGKLCPSDIIKEAQKAGKAFSAKMKRTAITSIDLELDKDLMEWLDKGRARLTSGKTNGNDKSSSSSTSEAAILAVLKSIVNNQAT